MVYPSGYNIILNF